MELQGTSLTRKIISTDIELCVICQKCDEDEPVSTKNGRKRVWEAADIRQDDTFNRLTQMGRNSIFKYHVSNICYKKYTHKGQLEKIVKRRKLVNELQTEEIAVTSERRQTRSSVNPVQGPICNPDVRQLNCVICGGKKHQGDYNKYKICEIERAKHFFKVSRFFKDDVFTRTANINDYTDILAKDLFYHPACMREYFNRYESHIKKLLICNSEEATLTRSKEEAISLLINDISPQLKSGHGFTLTEISAKLNKTYKDKYFTNRNIKKYLKKQFGEDIQFSNPKEANQPTMFFHSSVATEDVIDMMRSKNSIRDCAKLLRNSLAAVNFDLEDRFCDEKDLQLSVDNMKIPEPFTIFFAELFGCNERDFNQTGSVCTDNSDDTGEKQGCKSAKMLKLTSLFQTMFYILHNGNKKTPLHIMNGIAVHDACRSSLLIKSLNHIGVSIGYDEVLRYRYDLARFTTERSNGNVPIPSHFDKSMFTIGAFDNFDHNENTMSGLDSTHDTVSVLFQEKSLSQIRKPKVSETSVLHGNRTFREELICQKVIPFTTARRTPVKIPENFNVNTSLFEINNNEYNKIACKDLTWVISRTSLEQDVSHEQIIPSWSAFNANISESVFQQHIVGFLPLIPNPVTDFSTVYSALCNFKNVLAQIQQNVLPVACDEGVYSIAQQIILHRPEEFRSIFLLLGTFHMTKIFLACIGKYMKGSGVENIFIETSVFGVNVTEAVLNGTNYVRSFKGMLLLGETMLRLQLNEFFKENPLHNYDVNTALYGLRKCFQDNVDTTDTMKSVLNSMPTLLTDYEIFIERRSSESELFMYWSNVLKMITLLRDLVRSDREGNWLLHLHTVQKVLPLFAAFDRTNYLRWGSVYLENARKLEKTSPEVYEKFMKGAFVVQRSTNSFTAVAADMCLEQTINRSKKSVSGVIGITRQKSTVTEWEIIYHEIL